MLLDTDRLKKFIKYNNKKIILAILVLVSLSEKVQSNLRLCTVFNFHYLAVSETFFWLAFLFPALFYL